MLLYVISKGDGISGCLMLIMLYEIFHNDNDHERCKEMDWIGGAILIDPTNGHCIGTRECQ